jgi:hypothetical protein
MVNRREFLLVTGGLGLSAMTNPMAIGEHRDPVRVPFAWNESGLSVSFYFFGEQLRQQSFLPQGVQPPSDIPGPSQNSGLDVALHCTGENWNDHHGNKVTGCMPGARLVFSGTKTEEIPLGKRMSLVHRDPELELRVESVYEFFEGIPVARRYSNRLRKKCLLLEDRGCA